MTLPDAGPTTVALVKSHLGLTSATADDKLARIVNATNAYVRRLPVCQPVLDADTTADWSPDYDHIVEGATMLAARLYRRKDTPDGVATFGAEGAFYVSRNDPDVSMLLQLGVHAPPVVG